MAEDLSKISDAELDRRIASRLPKQDLSKLSDEELDAKIQEKIGGRSMGDQALDFVSRVGRTVDSYTGAPTRAALDEYLKPDNKFNSFEPSIVRAGKAFIGQFGENPDMAPTGKQIAEQRFGLSSESRPAAPSFGMAKGGEIVAPKAGSGFASPAGFVGAGIDLGADLGNIVPVGTVARGIGKGTSAALKVSQNIVEKVPGVKSVSEATARVLKDYLKPVTAADFPELEKIAAAKGINLTTAPESIEFGKNSAISRLSRVQAEGPMGQTRLDRHNSFMGEVSQAFENDLAKISGGAPISRVDAGNHIREAYDRSIEKLFNVAQNGYTDIVKTYPGLRLSEDAAKSLDSKLNGVEKYAKGLRARGLEGLGAKQGQYLLNAVNAVRNSNGSVKQSVEALREIGNVAYKTKTPVGIIPPDKAKTKEIYLALRDAITDTVRTDVQNGEAVAGALKISNDMMSDFFKKSQPMMEVLSNADLAPEQVFDRLTKNTSQIKSMKDIFDPTDFSKLKGAYLDSFIKRDELGSIRFQPLKSSIESRLNKEIIKEMFSPDELAELLSTAKLGERAGIPIMSTSGTGASNFFKNISQGAQQAIFNETAIDAMKASARKRGLAIPRQPVTKTPAPLFGPKAIGPLEAFGLRLPQQISIKEDKEEKKQGRAK